MAYRLGDGFDTYGAIADAATGSGAWDTSVSWSLSTTTRFATGQSFSGAVSASSLIKAGFSNQATLFFHVAHLQTSALGSATLGKFIQMRDGATAQCSIVFRGDGSIVLTSGVTTGTVLATYTGAFIANSFDSFQFKVVIDASAGEFHVRKNGAGSDSFSATGLNTRGGTANNYANAIAVGHSSGATITSFLDDFLHWDNSGSAPNTWVGDIRAIQLQPSADTAQKQFTQSGPASLAFSTTAGTSTSARLANTLYIANGGSPVIATQGGTLSSASVTFNAGVTGHAKLGVYLLDGDTLGFASNNNAGTLVGLSDEVTNPTATQVFTFSTPVNIKKGYSYGYAIMMDAAFTAKGPTLLNYSTYTTAISYAGGFPTSLVGVAPNSTSTSVFIQVVATLTATNAGCVNDWSEDGATTFLSDSTVGDYDLFTLPSLNYTPASVIGVTLRSFVAKSDSGARGFKIAGKSGSTSFETAEYSPLTTFSNFNTFYPTDPATSAAWTPSALNALQLGPKVSS